MQQCKLCLRHVAKLENSHFLSKGIFKRLREEAEDNPNPWLITKDVAVQTSKQMTYPLLCWDCEQRLREFGEDWVLRYCVQQDGSFPLGAVLAAKAPDVKSSKTSTRIYYAARVPEINVSALVYFAASIFWRGSIHPWNSDGTIPVELGPYQEQFRLYLMGLEPFPKDAALWVAVREGKMIDRLTYVPVGQRTGKFHFYKFPMPGFAFSLAVSKNVPTSYRENCLVYGQNNPLLVTSIIEPLLFGEAVKALARSDVSMAARAGK